jgi:hypothetical protein
MDTHTSVFPTQPLIPRTMSISPPRLSIPPLPHGAPRPRRPAAGPRPRYMSTTGRRLLAGQHRQQRPGAAAYVAVFPVGHMLPSTPAGHPPAAARSPTSVAVVQVKHPLPSLLQITLRGCRLLLLEFRREGRTNTTPDGLVNRSVII